MKSLKIAPLLAALLFFFGVSGSARPAEGAVLSLEAEKGAEAAEEKSESSRAPESPYRSIESIKPGEIIHLRTGLAVSEARLIDLLAPARVIYVGEVHDSLEDHRVQLKILKGLAARFPGKVVVGMEMFRRPSQPVLDRWAAGDADDKAFLKQWYQDWGSDTEYYAELLDFLQAERIPVIALKPSREMEVKVGMKGMAGLSDNDKRKLPEVDRSDPYHKEALQAIYAGHGRGADRFSAFYDTMLLWDESMAANIVRFMTSPAGADKRMVVFAGGFHVGYGFGIPRRVFRRLPLSYRIVIPYAKDFPEEKRMLDVTAPDLPLMLADFVWGVAYEAVETKQVRLGIFMEPFQAGVRVTNVFPGSAAALAGIEPGDIIAAFDGETITQPFDLIYALKRKEAGDKVPIRLIRDGKLIETEAVMKVSGSHP